MVKNFGSIAMTGPDRDRISCMLKESGCMVQVITAELMDSTNAEAKRYVRGGGSLPAVIAAGGQTAGRGRLGRSFFSPPDSGVYMSVVFDAGGKPGSMVSVTSMAAVAVMEAIFRVTGVRTGIKWVNDLYLDGKKVCGILAESFFGTGISAVVVGIGINLTTEDFPPDIAEKAGSIGADGVRDEIIAAVTVRLMELMKAQPAEYMDAYRRSSLVLGREITFTTSDGTNYSAVAESIEDDGGLTVVFPDGERRTLRTGEISVRL